jgi:hypothetical protein
MSASNVVRDRLRGHPLPGEAEAAARSWPVVEAALAASPPGARRTRVGLRLAVALALLCAALAITLSPAGAWIADRFAAETPSSPSFAALPEGGPVLAISGTGAYAISADGSVQRLGRFEEAGWSPHGKHVVGVDGRRLIAVTPTGIVKWTLVEPHRVRRPAWSTALGYAVAYLEGHSLRVVAGDGDPATNRLVRHGAARVTPAWHPDSDRVLTYVTRAGSIETVDVETGQTIWRTPPSGTTPRALAWSRDGGRLVALRSHSVTVLDRSGRVERTLALPGVARDLALDPSGRRAAIVIGNRVVEVGLSAGSRRQVFQGSVDGIAWSQDGRRLLVGWRDAGQWLLLGPGRRVRALHGVSRELGAAGGFPRVAGWCCAR